MVKNPASQIRLWVLCLAVIAVTLPLNYVLLFHLPLVEFLMGSNDNGTYYGPNAFFMDYCVRNGELPLWNPLTLCGLPFGSNPQSLIFYPPHFLRSLLPLSTCPFNSLLTLNIEILLHILVAFAGTFFLARSHDLSPPASLLAAFTYACSTPMIVSTISAVTFVTTAAWLPTIVLMLRRSLAADSPRDKLAYTLSAGLLLGLSILGGFPQLVIYEVLMLTAYCVFFRYLRLTESRTARRDGPVLEMDKDVLLLLVTFAVAVGVALVMLLPAAEYAGLCTRAKDSFLTVRYLSQSGIDHFPRLVRAGTLLLACAAFYHIDRKSVALYALLAVILLDCLNGPPSPIDTLLRWLAPFQLGSPNRAAVILALPVGMLAAYGLDAVAALKPGSEWTYARPPLLFLSLGALLAAISIWWPYCITTDALLPKMLPLVLAVTLVLATRFHRPESWRLIVLAVAVCELLMWNAWAVWFNVERFPHDVRTGTFSSAQTMTTLNRRVASARPNAQMYRLQPAMNGYEDMQLHSTYEVLCAPGEELDYGRKLGVRAVTGRNNYGNLFLKRLFWLARQYVSGPLPPKETLFPAATTVFLQNPPELPVPEVQMDDLPRSSISQDARKLDISWILADGTSLIKTQQGFTFDLAPFVMQPYHSALFLEYESNCGFSLDAIIRDPVTGSWCYGKRCVLLPAKEGPETIEIPLPCFRSAQVKLKVRQWRPSGTVRFSGASLLIDEADESALVKLTSLRANAVELEVGVLRRPRILTFLDAQYPGWKAYVDSERVPIYKANDAFKAVLVPPGLHRVRFEFRPWQVYAGLALSCLTTLAVLGLIWSLSRKPKAPPDSTGGS